MDDPTGLAKLADSKLLNKAYDDLLADAMKEGGQALVNTVKAFRLFTAPIQLLAVAQDRLKAFCEKVRQRVPEERQVEAPPSIALPVLLSLRYMEDDNLLTELFLNLLARAIDKERQGEAHPAFARIIEQLSPDEAMVMLVLRDSDIPVKATSIFLVERISARFAAAKEIEFPKQRLVYAEQLLMYLDHLQTLGMLTATTLRDEHADSRRNMVTTTDFGKVFTNACIPEDFELPKSSSGDTDSET